MPSRQEIPVAWPITEESIKDEGTLVGTWLATYSSGCPVDEDGLETTEGTVTEDTGTTGGHDSQGSGVGR